MMIDDNNRSKIFCKISDNVTDEERIIGHFLLTFTEIYDIYCNSYKSKEKPIHGILDKWFETTLRINRTWQYLRLVLLFVENRKLVKDLDEGIMVY